MKTINKYSKGKQHDYRLIPRNSASFRRFAFHYDAKFMLEGSKQGLRSSSDVC